LTIAAALSSAGFLAAALCSALGSRLALAGRILAGVSALALLPGIDVPSRWPAMALAAGAAAFASPLPCLLAAAGSLLVLVQPETARVALAPALLALAAALAAGALSSTLRARFDEGAETMGLLAAAGAALVALLLSLDGAAVLRWGFALGSGPSRLELRGAGLLLGLTLLFSLGGTLLLAAHRMAPSVPGVRELGLRLLLPGAALALLSAGHITLQGARRGSEALAGEADALVALVLVSGTLAAALGHTVSHSVSATSPSGTGWAERETALAASVAWVAAGVAGWECWQTQGTYLCPGAATAAAAGVLGVTAIAPTALPGTRRLLLLASLILAVLFPGLLG
jgi:hypothetical protein